MPVSEVRTQIYLDREQHRALKKEAERREVSMAQVVREAVAAYLLDGEEEGGPADEQVLADSAWDLPEIAARFPGTGLGDAAERHDDLLYGARKPAP